MDVFILLKFFFFFLCASPLVKSSPATSCKSAKCSLLSPEIRFPFRIHNLQPHHCGLPPFNLFCRQNRTMIHFPSYGDLVVKSISYDTKRLGLLDPKNCVHEVFLNLNLSLTPFDYYYVVKQYKYINCSDKLVGSYEQVPCLSGSDHHIYVVSSSFHMPDSCTSVKTVAVPFSYSRYLSDSSFGLGFTWNSATGLKEEVPDYETGRSNKYFTSFYAVSGIMVLVFIVGLLLIHATLSQYHEELNEEKVKDMPSTQGEIDKLLGEYQHI